MEQISASSSIVAWIAGMAAAVAAGIWIARLVSHSRARRRARWRAKVAHTCREIAVLRGALMGLMQRVPDGSHWEDDDWTKGDGRAQELCKSIEELGAEAPRSSREALWNLIASLRALVVAIGNDPVARSRPVRAEVIRRRLVDLGPAAHSLRATDIGTWTRYRPKNRTRDRRRANRYPRVRWWS